MVIRILLVLLALMICTGPVSAFGDSVQRYDVDYTDIWDETDSAEFYQSYANGPGWSYSDFSIENRPVSYSSSNAMKFYVSAQGRYEHYSGTATVTITSKDLVNSDYLSLTVYDASVSDGTLKVYYYNESMDLMATTNLGVVTKSVGSPDRYELVRSGSNIELYKNGVYVSVSALSGYDDVYIRIQAYAHGSETGSVLRSLTAYIDDISTSSILGMNLDWTQSSTYIDTSYGVQSMGSFPSADYSVQTSRITSGAVINTTELGTGASGDPVGFIRWNRNNIFGNNFGLYQSRILRDGNVLASTKFSIFDSTVAGSVSWIDDSYATGATAGINYDLVSPDFSSYYYYLHVINSGGTGFSQNLITTSGTELVTLTGYPVGDCYTVLSRTSISTGVSSDIAYGLMTVTAAGAGPVDSISIPYTEYERGDTVDVTFSHEESGYIVIHDVRSSGNYYVSDGFIGSGSNMSYSFIIDDLDQFGFYYVVLKNSDHDIKDNTGYTLVETTSPYNNSISVDAAEYYYDGIVNVTYSHSQGGCIAVQHVQSNDVYHMSNSFDGDGNNETWLFNIAGTDPLGLYNVLLLSDDDFVKSSTSYTVTPAAMSSTWLNVIEESVVLYEDVHIAYKAVNSSMLTITDPNGYEVYNQSVQSSVIRYVYHTVMNGTGTYNVELDGDTLESDSFFVYLIDDPDVYPPDIDYDPDDGVIDEDVLDPDETMTEYYNEKFRDFAPTIWGFFMLMCLLFLMSILTSFGSGGKRR
jgi:hypothetical protein